MIKQLLTFVLFALCALAAFSQPAAQTPTHDPQALLRAARTLSVHSNTAFLLPDTLERALLQQKQWKSLGIVLVGERGGADLTLEVDRQIFTHIHTFVLSDHRTAVILGAGRQRALDGTLAADGLASDVVALILAARQAGSPVRNGASPAEPAPDVPAPKMKGEQPKPLPFAQLPATLYGRCPIRVLFPGVPGSSAASGVITGAAAPTTSLM